MITSIPDFENYFRLQVQKMLKTLLESKHLYQSVSLDLQAIRAEIEAAVEYDPRRTGMVVAISNRPHRVGDPAAEFKATLHRKFLAAIKAEWSWQTEQTNASKIAAGNSPAPLEMILPRFERACPLCSAVNPPHTVGYLGERVGEPWNSVRMLGKNGAFSDVLVVSYQCQSCMGEPVVFLIRRVVEKMTLVGRSRFARVDVPSFYPGTVAKFYSESLIALAAGKPLAGCLYLRVLIEKHIRSVVPDLRARLTGEELWAAYIPLLPEEFPPSARTLLKCYGELSEAIHDGKEDDVLLAKCLEGVDRHFKMLAMVPLELSPKGNAANEAPASVLPTSSEGAD